MSAATVRRRTTTSVECYKTSLGRLLEQLCGSGARHKRVPAVVAGGPLAIKRAFLDGYLAGDGHTTASHRVATTVSVDLALGLYQLGLGLDVLPMFYESTPPAKKAIEGRLVNQSKLYFVKFGKKRLAGEPAAPARWRDLGDRFAVPITEVKSVAYTGSVYNLEVDDPDHSYVAPFVAVSNCQNWEISNEGAGELVTKDELAALMIELQDRGCHNINFVTPEHVVPQVLEALPIACERGLRLPIVYNTSAYDSLDSLALLDGVFDVYMPDFKYWEARTSARFLKAKDYPEVARAAIREMHRQVGDLTFDGEGLARRGLLVRHLVMPDGLDDTAAILRWLHDEISPMTYVNVMDQYHPDGNVLRDRERYAQLARPTTAAEHRRALAHARAVGLTRIDERRPHRKLRARLPVLW